MNSEIKRLRNLPGIQRISELCRIPANFDDLSRSDTMIEIDNVSIQLFCIGQIETIWHIDDDDGPDVRAEAAAYETQFDNVMRPYAQSQPFWELLDWDITDGNGKELNCAVWFARQIIALEGSLVDGVCFKPDGSGDLAPSAADEDEEGELERWSEALEAQAQQFIKGR